MKHRIMVYGLIASLAISAALPVLADPPGGDRRPAGGAQPGGGGGGPRPGGPGRPGGGGHVTPGRPGNPGGGGGRPTPGRPGAGPGGHHPTPSRPGNRPQPGPGHRPPSRPGHGPSNRPIYGWNGHRFRAGAFRYPAGFGYRNWSVGQSLPSLLFSSAYYFTNYAVLGLDPPPWGYQWVRYGPDVMLVNIRTGEILDVNRGVFY